MIQGFTSSRRRSMIWREVIPSAWALKLVMILCLKIEGTTALTSSTDATYLLFMIALAFAARMRCWDALGPAPHSTHSFTKGKASGPLGREERTNLTAYPMT